MPFFEEVCKYSNLLYVLHTHRTHPQPVLNCPRQRAGGGRPPYRNNPTRVVPTQQTCRLANPVTDHPVTDTPSTGSQPSHNPRTLQKQCSAPVNAAAAPALQRSPRLQSPSLPFPAQHYSLTETRFDPAQHTARIWRARCNHQHQHMHAEHGPPAQQRADSSSRTP